MINKIHKLEQDIIQFKASQNIGSSNSRIIKVAHIDISKNTDMGLWVVGVFKSPDNIHPIIMPKLSCKAGGQDIPTLYVNGVKQSGWYSRMDYKDTYALGLLTYYGVVDENIFDEHTTTFMLWIDTTDPNIPSTTITIEGDLYATCQGTLEIYSDEP